MAAISSHAVLFVSLWAVAAAIFYDADCPKNDRVTLTSQRPLAFGSDIDKTGNWVRLNGNTLAEFSKYFNSGADLGPADFNPRARLVPSNPASHDGLKSVGFVDAFGRKAPTVVVSRIGVAVSNYVQQQSAMEFKVVFGQLVGIQKAGPVWNGQSDESDRDVSREQGRFYLNQTRQFIDRMMVVYQGSPQSVLVRTGLLTLINEARKSTGNADCPKKSFMKMYGPIMTTLTNLPTWFKPTYTG